MYESTQGEAQDDAQGAPTVTGRIQFHPDEAIIAVVRPSVWWTLGGFVFTLGLWELWRRRHAYVLTTERLVSLKGIINKTQRTVSLQRIQDVNVLTSPIIGGRVEVSTAGGDPSIRDIPHITQSDARKFADAAQQQMQSLGGTPTGL